MIRPLHLALLLACLTAAPVSSAPLSPDGAPVFWVGAAAPCNFNDLQTAIDAVPDGAEIRIAGNQAYDDINVEIDDKSLILAGGWADCAGTVNSQPVALTGAAAGIARPVVRVASAVTPRLVILRRLHVSGGRRSGIELEGQVELRVERSVVDGNEAFYGGGIRVIGAGPAQTVLRVAETLVGNADDPALPGNTAVFHGGGIHCLDAQVRLQGAAVRNNTAGSLGGGVYADGCEVRSGFNTYGFPGIGEVTMLIEANEAEFDGGGIYADGGSTLTLAPATPSAFAIRGNRADDGGGVALAGAGTSLLGEGLKLIDNWAEHRGGAGYITGGAHLTLRREAPPGPVVSGQEAGPDGVIVITTYCEPHMACNQVRLNRAEETTGGAFFVDGAGLTLQHTQVAENYAGNGSQILLANGSGSRIENSLIHGNDSNGGDLVRVIDNSSFVLNSSTVADNATGNTLIRLFSGGGGNNLNLRNSVFWEPGTSVLVATAADTVASTCLNAHEDVSVPALTHAPGFVDAAAGNYRLHASSANIDACADPFLGVPVVDILGVARPADLGPDAGAGDFDRGAYELGDLIFAHDFGEPSPF